MKLERNFQIFEYFLILFYIFQILITDVSVFTIMIFFSTFFFSKYFFEGFRINTIILFICQILILIFSFRIFQIILVIITLFLVEYFPIFKYPEVTGNYKVGYLKYFTKNLRMAIFYPTLEEKNDVCYFPHDEHWVRFYEIMKMTEVLSQGKIKYLIPKFFHKIFLSSLEKQSLRVNEKAKIIDNSNGFPVVVFSHGLSANRLLYCNLLKEWASHGFIVFSLEHDEKILIDVKNKADAIEVRSTQLKERVNSINDLIELIYNQNRLQYIFENSNLKIIYDKIFMVGHSFGGATALEVAYYNQKITGGIILLDPWFEPLRNEIYHKKTNLPIINIRSNEFQKIAILNDLSEKYNKKYQNSEEFISGYFNDSSHNCMTDLVLFMPKELSFFGIVNMNSINEYLNYHINISTSFLKAVSKNQKNIRNYLIVEINANLKRTGKSLDTFKLDS